MIEILITLIAFLFLILAVIWLPFIKQISESSGSVKQSATKSLTNANRRDAANVSLYHEHKAEIEQDFQQGNIDEENYQYLLTELDQSLLQDIEANKAEDKTIAAQNKTLSIVWPSLISLFVLVFSIAFYYNSGAYQNLTDQKRISTEQPNNLDQQQQAINKIKELQQLTINEPENSDAWYSLGQALVSIGEFKSAIKAFDQVVTIEGEHADILGVKAQAAYYDNGQKIDERVQRLIDKALALDPLDSSTNILLGMHNFINQNYQDSIMFWQKVVDSARPNVNINALSEAINEAKNRLSLTGEKQTNTITNNDTLTTGPQLNVEVTLSDEVLAKISQGEDKTVFVYATPTDGQRMPLAAVKINASDLPLLIVLNDASAMTPQAILSSVEKVHLYAVLSEGGGAGIKKGDYKAQVNNVSVSTKTPIKLIIDTLVP